MKIWLCFVLILFLFFMHNRPDIIKCIQLKTITFFIYEVGQTIIYLPTYKVLQFSVMSYFIQIWTVKHELNYACVYVYTSTKGEGELGEFFTNLTTQSSYTPHPPTFCKAQRLLIASIQTNAVCAIVMKVKTQLNKTKSYLLIILFCCFNLFWIKLNVKGSICFIFAMLFNKRCFKIFVVLKSQSHSVNLRYFFVYTAYLLLSAQSFHLDINLIMCMILLILISQHNGHEDLFALW